MPAGGNEELQLPVMKSVGLAKILPINIEFSMARRNVEIQVCRGVWPVHWSVSYVPDRGNVDVVIHALFDDHGTVWAMHVLMMSMRIDRIANRATQDNVHVKAAV
jgi:hypothetical protein